MGIVRGCSSVEYGAPLMMNGPVGEAIEMGANSFAEMGPCDAILEQIVAATEHTRAKPPDREPPR
jgi:hypothetical protein